MPPPSGSNKGGQRTLGPDDRTAMFVGHFWAWSSRTPGEVGVVPRAGTQKGRISRLQISRHAAGRPECNPA